jgi:hypothetical protein
MSKSMLGAAANAICCVEQPPATGRSQKLSLQKAVSHCKSIVGLRKDYPLGNQFLLFIFSLNF